uniref:DDE Tnp4 domain-containing protein n=1 Tax=Megaselia scalaris TaxID=36166 RepID=T1GHH8_MEGSC
MIASRITPKIQPFSQKLLLALRFYVSGSIGDFAGVTQTTAGRIVTMSKFNLQGQFMRTILEIGKAYMSINVQATCDVNFMFTMLVCHWPGSTHDSTIYNSSKIKFMASSIKGQIILGDGCYQYRLHL